MREDARTDGHDAWLEERLGSPSLRNDETALESVALRCRLYAAADDSALTDRLRERLIAREVHRDG
jgi:hypothetical protein